MSVEALSLRDEDGAEVSERCRLVATPRHDEVEHCLSCEKGSAGSGADGSAIAAPTPLVTRPAQAGAHGVLHDVPASAEQVRVRRDELAPEPSPEHVIDPCVSQVVGDSMSRVEFAHPA